MLEKYNRNSIIINNIDQLINCFKSLMRIDYEIESEFVKSYIMLVKEKEEQYSSKDFTSEYDGYQSSSKKTSNTSHY